MDKEVWDLEVLARQEPQKMVTAAAVAAVVVEHPAVRGVVQVKIILMEVMLDLVVQVLWILHKLLNKEMDGCMREMGMDILNIRDILKRHKQ